MAVMDWLSTIDHQDHHSNLGSGPIKKWTNVVAEAAA